MSRLSNQLRGGFLLLFALLNAHACTDSPPTPVSPTGATGGRLVMPISDQAQLGPIDWLCGRSGTQQSSDSSKWVFHTANCASTLMSTAPGSASAALTGPPPFNFRATVNGSTVRLDWDYLGFRSGFQLEAGSSPGLANLAVFQVPPSSTASNFVVVNNVPNGVYYVRVRAFALEGAQNTLSLGDPTPDIVVSVGAGCVAAPGQVTGLSSFVAGNTVQLLWTGAANASTYVVEAGSSPGLANLAVFDTGNAGTTVSAFAPNGVYYVRVRGRNACGGGAASNEIIVAVGTTTSILSTSVMTTVPGGGGGPTTTIATTSTVPPGVTTTTTTTVPGVTTTSTTSTTTTIQAFTASVSSSGSCLANRGCHINCVLEATSNVPTPTTWEWNLGNGVTATTNTPTLSNPDFTSHCPSAPPGAFNVSVSVTVSGPSGKASGSGNVPLFKT